MNGPPLTLTWKKSVLEPAMEPWTLSLGLPVGGSRNVTIWCTLDEGAWSTALALRSASNGVHLTPDPSLEKLAVLTTRIVEPLPVNGWLGFWIRFTYARTPVVNSNGRPFL